MNLRQAARQPDAGGQRGEHGLSRPHSAANRRSRAACCASIHAEMDLIRRRRLGLIFVLSLSVLRALPGGLAGRVNHGRCEATCVLSNLGRALADSPLPRCNEKIVAGNVVLDGVDFFVPVRDGTAVTVGLVYYAGGLQICLQYDRRRITEAQAGDLLATYLRKIRARRHGRPGGAGQSGLIAEEGNRDLGMPGSNPDVDRRGPDRGTSGPADRLCPIPLPLPPAAAGGRRMSAGGRHPLRARTRPLLAGMPERLVPAGLPRLRRVDRGR